MARVRSSRTGWIRPRAKVGLLVGVAVGLLVGVLTLWTPLAPWTESAAGPSASYTAPMHSGPTPGPLATASIQLSRAHDPYTYVSPTPTKDALFGSSVAVGGSTVVVGAVQENVSGKFGAGAVYLFKSTTSALLRTITSPNLQVGGEFGASVAISGKYVVIGAPDENVSTEAAAGHAYVFTTSGALMAILTSPSPQKSGCFGTSVAVSGSTVAVGAPCETVSAQVDAGHVYLFHLTGALLRTLASPDALYYGKDARSYFGSSVALSGSTLVVGAPSEDAPSERAAGHVYVYKATTGVLLATLTSPNPVVQGQFGAAVALSGTSLLIGAPGETVSSLKYAGHAYLYDLTTGLFTETFASPNVAFNASFGAAVAISKSSVIIGAWNESIGADIGAGHAYSFTATGTLLATLVSSTPQTGGRFGASVAISGKTVLIGAPGETVTTVPSAGHVYQS